MPPATQQLTSEPDAALYMLQDWNAHLAYALVATVQKGDGTVERRGRTVTVVLPEWWENR